MRAYVDNGYRHTSGTRRGVRAYREMTEWALPPDDANTFPTAVRASFQAEVAVAPAEVLELAVTV